MSDLLTLRAQKREQTGKGVSRRLRASGQIPAVFYNSKGDNKPLTINEKELSMLYQQVKRTKVFNLEISGGGTKETHPALIWDVDYFPVKNRIQHLDIFGVDLEKTIKIRIPLEFTGTAKGAKLGGQMQVYHETVMIIGKPLALPQKISVDVSDLEINNSIQIKDLHLSKDLKADMDPETALAAIIMISESTEEGGAETDSAPAAAAE